MTPLVTRILRRSEQVDPPEHAAHLGPCRIWLGATQGGYGVISVGGRGAGRTYIHRAMFEEFVTTPRT